MDSFELNKIAGAVLATGLLIMALSITSEIIYEPADLRENGYVIAVSETDHGAGPEAVEAIEPIAVRLQAADPAAGEASAKKCQACHTFEEGGPPKVGPNLYGIVSSQAAHAPGFNYSAAMAEKSAEGMAWSFEELDRFLANPKAEVPGTIMAFAGLKKPDERADVIAYLNTLSASPLPLPEVPAATPEEAMPAGEGADASAPMSESGSDQPAAAQDTMAPATETPAPAGEQPAAGQDAMVPTPPAEMPAPAADQPAADTPAGNSAH